MIKVPATPEGFPALTALIRKGISVNMTLIFSRVDYAQTVDAYLRGLEQRLDDGESVANVTSVASFFISRIDRVTDKFLPEGSPLRGTIAIANARLAYRDFESHFTGERFHALSARGARIQRPLWASTSTKNPDYSDVHYPENLIGPRCVCAMPIRTLEAFRDHGRVRETLRGDLDRAEASIQELEERGIDFDAITRQLRVDGVQGFARSFNALLETLDEKKNAILASGAG